MVLAGVLLAAALDEALDEELFELHPLSARAAAAPVAALPAKKPRRVSFGCSMVPSNLWSAGRLSRARAPLSSLALRMLDIILYIRI